MKATNRLLPVPQLNVFNNSWMLEGIKQYSCSSEAILNENSNDAVHLFFPDKLIEKAEIFLNIFSDRCLYAIKANPHPAVLKTLWHAGMRSFDVASIREIKEVIALFPTARLYFMHPVKSRQAIREAYSLGVRTFAVDHIDELNKIREETGFARDIDLLLRISVNRKGAAYSLDGKFGARREEAVELLQQARNYSSKLGVCFHVGSQCMRPQAFYEAIHDVAQIIGAAGIEIDLLDVGGGFPVDYPDLAAPQLDLYFDEINKAIKECGMEHLEILCEPGRALVAESCAVAARIELRKDRELYINDGVYGSLFDAGIMNWSYPVEKLEISGITSTEETDDFKLFGPSCDSCDVMEGPFKLPSDVSEGDWIIFYNLGAYGYAMQSQFNGFYSDTMAAITENRNINRARKRVMDAVIHTV